MAGPDECTALLREGHGPSAIAAIRGVTVGTVCGYLDRAVGAGALRRSLVYLSVAPEARELVEKVVTERGLDRDCADVDTRVALADALPHIDPADIQVCLRYGPVSRYYGDLYEELRGYEVDLHKLVRHVLEREYDGDRTWWYEGVDEKIRVGAASRAEVLRRPDRDPWHFVYLVDLSVIVTKRWTLFSPLLRSRSSRDFSAEVSAVNEVRNRVMHPVRDMPPSESDFDLVHMARARVDAARAAFYGPGTAANLRTN